MLIAIKESGKRIILNIGDSSTSGWDSNVVTENRKRLAKGEALKPAFFQYQTYSDYLREIAGNQFTVINAGVPAHTSLQGRRRLEQLVDKFASEGIKVDYVTAYYGNNDSVWEGNKEEKDLLAPSIAGMIRKIFSKCKRNVVTRTTAEDYQRNMGSIVEFCRERKIKPILIEPQTPIYWKPGTRVKDEEIIRDEKSDGRHSVYALLDYATKLWEKILPYEYSDLKKAVLEEIREMDFVVPRIKREHLQRLHDAARLQNAPLVSINLDRTEDDIRYFIDYCHPIGDTNKQIAEKIAETINEYETGKRTDDCLSGYKTPLRYRLLDKTLKVLSHFVKPSSKQDELPADRYTLY